MSYEPREVLRHILVEADFLIGVRETLTRQALEENDVLQQEVRRLIDAG
jgi:hypothetical protein